jgi:hypothetical protein
MLVTQQRCLIRRINLVATSNEFEEFVNRQQQPAQTEKPVDWNAQLREWRAHLGSLYDLITAHLKPYIDGGTVNLSRDEKIEITEENIGTYEVDRLNITIGSQRIQLNPVGTLLIGAKGRVDVKGSAGSSRLVLIRKEVTNPSQLIRVTIHIAGSDSRPPKIQPNTAENAIEWAWKISTPPPRMQYIELNQETLFTMLMEVSNG